MNFPPGGRRRGVIEIPHPAAKGCSPKNTLPKGLWTPHVHSKSSNLDSKLWTLINPAASLELSFLRKIPSNQGTFAHADISKLHKKMSRELGKVAVIIVL